MHTKAQAHNLSGPITPEEDSSEHQYLGYARRVLDLEAQAISSISPLLGQGFVRTIDLILDCKGHVVITGIGKPGFIAQKLSATLASTGTHSLYLHPAEAVHGDLGRVTPNDIVLALSNSGKSEEILRILPSLRRIGTVIVAITGESSSPLAKGADIVVEIGHIHEACPMGLVPTASSAALHAVCDAISMTVLQNRPITNERYALFHPGGALGRQVARVYEVMRAGEANPVVFQGEPLFRAVAIMTNTPGRPGVTSVVDADGKLVGVFTDGDLRRLVEMGRQDFTIELSTVMCKNPRTCFAEELVHAAASRMRESRIDQLPVVDREGRPIGLLDVQDLLAARFL